MRITVGIAVLSALVLLAQPATGSAAPDAAEIARRARAALAPGADMRASFELQLINARGEEVAWTGRYYRRDGSDPRVRLVFDAPLDLRGTDVMVGKGPDGKGLVRIYLPAVRRVREITGDMRGESFLGTDFNYEDLGIQPLEIGEESVREVSGARGDCHHLESIPERGWWYGRIVRCLDKKTFLPTRTEYYDRGGQLWKLRTIDRLERIDSHPTPVEVTMKTVPTGTATRLLLIDVEYDIGLDSALFETRPGLE